MRLRPPAAETTGDAGASRIGSVGLCAVNRSRLTKSLRGLPSVSCFRFLQAIESDQASRRQVRKPDRVNLVGSA